MTPLLVLLVKSTPGQAKVKSRGGGSRETSPWGSVRTGPGGFQDAESRAVLAVKQAVPSQAMMELRRKAGPGSD